MNVPMPGISAVAAMPNRKTITSAGMPPAS